jgi:hypothetical protein
LIGRARAPHRFLQAAKWGISGNGCKRKTARALSISVTLSIAPALSWIDLFRSGTLFWKSSSCFENSSTGDAGARLITLLRKPLSPTLLPLAVPMPDPPLSSAYIEVFPKDVLALEGEIWNLAICEEQFRDAETNKRMKDRATRACRTLCRVCVNEEIRRRKGTSTAEHLKIVLSIIDSAALFPLNDD